MGVQYIRIMGFIESFVLKEKNTISNAEKSPLVIKRGTVATEDPSTWRFTWENHRSKLSKCWPIAMFYLLYRMWQYHTELFK